VSRLLSDTADDPEVVEFNIAALGTEIEGNRNSWRIF